MLALPGNWKYLDDLGPQTYVCGYCGATTGVRTGYHQENGRGRIYICGGCNRPTYFNTQDEFIQTPFPLMGNPVLHLPLKIGELYEQARRTIQVEAFSGCILLCRKILMHIAVEEGAAPNQNFLNYVEYLVDNSYVPPKGRGWVDQIRQRGNEANHELVIVSPTDAMDLLTFVEMLLKLVYEYPARGNQG